MILRSLTLDAFFPFCNWPDCLPWMLVILCLSLNFKNFIPVYLRINSCLLTWLFLVHIRFWHFRPYCISYGFILFSSSKICPFIGCLSSVLGISLSFGGFHLLVFPCAVGFLCHFLSSISLTGFPVLLSLDLFAYNVAFALVTVFFVFICFFP